MITDRWMNKEGVVNTYNRLLLSHKKEGNNTVWKVWMGLEIIILSDVSQKEQDKYSHVESKIRHKWPHLQNRLRDREDTEGRWGRRAGEGRTRALGWADATARLSVEVTTWCCLHRELQQYHAINHDGKEEKRLFLNPKFLIYKTGVAIPNLKLLKGLSTWKQSHHL